MKKLFIVFLLLVLLALIPLISLASQQFTHTVQYVKIDPGFEADRFQGYLEQGSFETSKVTGHNRSGVELFVWGEIEGKAAPLYLWVTAIQDGSDRATKVGYLLTGALPTTKKEVNCNTDKHIHYDIRGGFAGYFWIKVWDDTTTYFNDFILTGSSDIWEMDCQVCTNHTYIHNSDKGILNSNAYHAITRVGNPLTDAALVLKASPPFDGDFITRYKYFDTGYSKIIHAKSNNQYMDLCYLRDNVE